ncbi:hypothetical protein RMATCC62417_01328 [Rhizopus microsporus]|nr:hypothetical protein RMATCC62417_01328 [Rhizopus microsporus]
MAAVIAVCGSCSRQYPGSSKKSNNAATNEKEIIKGLRHELCVPDFWVETEWQQWSVQNFDCEAIKQNPGITRSVAHDDLGKDLNTLIKALDKNSRKAQRLKQIKLAMKTVHLNSVNSHFWRVRAVKSAKLRDKQIIAKMSRAVAEENLTTATLSKITKNVNFQAIKKRTHEEMTDDEECDKDESEEDDGYEGGNDSNSNDMTKKKYGEKDDEQEEFIDSIQKNIVNSSNDGRHELFKWAFKLHKNEDYTPSEDDVNELLLRQKSDLDHLNRLSISILKNWMDNDEVLGQILRISLSGIIDLAHDWTSQYCKSVFPDARWSEFEKLSYPIYNLTQESNEIYTNVMRILKSEDQKPDHERQPEHEALIYLSEKKHEYRKKKLDCEELQIIEILDTLIQNIIHDLNGNESELECMEGSYSVLKIVFRGSKYKFKLGEQACVESKTVREENEKAYASNETLDSTQNIMGRRIDLLLSSFQTNISSCEWKAENVSPPVARR